MLPPRVTDRVRVTVVVPETLAFVELGLRAGIEFVGEFGAVKLIWPLVGPRKSKRMEPEDCPEATVKVNGVTGVNGAVARKLCGVNLLATIGMEKVCGLVKSAMG